MYSIAIWLVAGVLELIGGMTAAPYGPEGNHFYWLMAIQGLLVIIAGTAETAYSFGRKNR